MDNMEKYELEMIEIEKEEFMGKANYKTDLSDERTDSRKKVRNKRRNKKAYEKGPYIHMGDSLLFRISKRIKELESSLTYKVFGTKKEDKILKELSELYTALENIYAASSDSRKMQKVILKYKDIA